MKSSKRSVKRAMRSRRSSNPKVMAGRVSAIDGASAVESGARMALVERDGSKSVDIVILIGCQRNIRHCRCCPSCQSKDETETKPIVYLLLVRSNER